MDKNFGIIGAGNMAKAILEGLLKQNKLNSERVFASTKTESSLEKLKKYNINTSLSNDYVVEHSDIVMIGVKPHIVKEVFSNLKADYRGKTFISIAAGWNLKGLSDVIGEEAKIICCMPNTPALVGEGVFGFCKNENVSDEEFEEIIDMFRAIGMPQIIDESLMDILGALSGAGPAFLYMMVEAMADGAVFNKMPRDMAYKLCGELFVGVGKMVLETGKHPGELKDSVCSPGGSTIEGVKVLEEYGVRAALINAITASCEKNKLLGK